MARVPVTVFFFQAEDGIRDLTVTGVQTCALPILAAGAATGFDASSPPTVRYGSVIAPRRSVPGLNCVPPSPWCRPTGQNGPARARSGERRVGEEGRCRGAPDYLKKKKEEKSCGWA